ncbi:MAG TPA: hypothetical protein VHL14_07060 [Steroidobacteraceae bacterium]|nr:hypothetical protein [Steroidobacteraceae bacterium]
MGSLEAELIELAELAELVELVELAELVELVELAELAELDELGAESLCDVPPQATSVKAISKAIVLITHFIYPSPLHRYNSGLYRTDAN